MRRTTALIIGGGPAGAATAISLARLGVRAEVIERSEGARDVVCGGFLGWDALGALDELGVDAFALGGEPITHLRLVSGTERVEVALPRRAAGLSRRTLDEALLARAASAGAQIRRGRSVRALDASALSVRMDDGEEIQGESLFLATGKHELRGHERPRFLTAAGAVGLRSTLAPGPATARLAGFIELHLFDGGYAGLLMQEDDRANLCISVTKKRFSRVGSIPALLAEFSTDAPLLFERLSGMASDEWSAVAGVPYGWRATRTSQALFRLGDQGAVISSLAGDGVAIALASGISAAATFSAKGPAGSLDYQRRLSRMSRLPLGVADLLRHLAERRSTRPLLMHGSRSAGLASLAAKLTRIT